MTEPHHDGARPDEPHPPSLRDGPPSPVRGGTAVARGGPETPADLLRSYPGSYAAKDLHLEVAALNF